MWQWSVFHRGFEEKERSEFNWGALHSFLIVNKFNGLKHYSQFKVWFVFPVTYNIIYPDCHGHLLLHAGFNRRFPNVPFFLTFKIRILAKYFFLWWVICRELVYEFKCQFTTSVPYPLSAYWFIYILTFKWRFAISSFQWLSTVVL